MRKASFSIRPSIQEKAGKWQVFGYFSGVRIASINVPLNYRPVFGANQRLELTDVISGEAARRLGDDKDKPHYNVKVAWGKRLEPWIVNATTR